MSTTDLANINTNTDLAVIDLEKRLKSSSEIVNNLLPSQLRTVISGLHPQQIKSITELKPGESVDITILRPRTWSELTDWAGINFPIQDILTIQYQPIAENQL